MLHFYILTVKESKSYLYDKKNKIPRHEPTKETKDLYTENYKMLMKEIKNDTDGKIYHALESKESILSKLLYYPRQSTDSAQSLLNYQ